MPLLINRPSKVIAVGVNYAEHAKEAGRNLPATPMVFAHFPSALIGPGDPIVLPDPALDTQIDFEAELAVVIGRQAKGVSAADALDHVRGYCCANDVSARTLQRTDSGGQMTMGKSLDTFDPIGAMTPAEEIADPQSLGIRTILNGEVMQDGTTAGMIFSVAELIEFITRTVTLEPDDVIITGTPEGVGALRSPAVFLQPGDEVTIEIDGLEPLTNPVVRG